MMSLSFRYPTNPISYLIIYRCEVPSFLHYFIPRFRISLFFPYLVSLFSIHHVIIGSVLLKRLSEAYLYKWLLPQFLISYTHSVVLPRKPTKAYPSMIFPFLEIPRFLSFPYKGNPPKSIYIPMLSEPPPYLY